MVIVRPHKLGLALAGLIGGWHLIWSILVASDWAQPIIDFVFWMHFIKPVYVVEPFSFGRAVVLLVITCATGYVVGVCAAWLWNRLEGPTISPRDIKRA